MLTSRDRRLTDQINSFNRQDETTSVPVCNPGSDTEAVVRKLLCRAPSAYKPSIPLCMSSTLYHISLELQQKNDMNIMSHITL